MAKELAFRKALAHRAAMDSDEAEPATLLVQPVNCARQNLLPCSGLALQEHGHVAYLRRFVRTLQKGCHSRARGDKSEFREDLAKFFRICRLLGHCPSPLGRSLSLASIRSLRRLDPNLESANGSTLRSPTQQKHPFRGPNNRKTCRL